MKDKKYYQWISAVLQNDENSTDQELRTYFMKEGKMSLKEADFYVKQRDDALKEIHFELEKYK